MNTNEIRFYLHNYDNLKKKVKNLKETLDEYRQMTGLKARVITDTPAPATYESKLEQTVITRMKYMKDLEAEIDSKMRLLNAINSVYFYLKEPDRSIFEMRYFITPMEGDVRKPKYNWLAISQEVGKSEAHCKNIDCVIVKKIQTKLLGGYKNVLKDFIRIRCPYKNNWCNGKHIPDMKMISKRTKEGYPVFTDEDLSKIKDKKPCKYFKDKKCMHPKYPRGK